MAGRHPIRPGSANKRGGHRARGLCLFDRGRHHCFVACFARCRWSPPPSFPAGCAGLDVLDAVTPAGRYTATIRHRLWHTLPRQALDVYRPLGAGPHPVIVFFYGGGWECGERGQYRFVAETLTRHGYVVVIPDYRVYPEVRFPAFIEDGARAVRWARDHAAHYGGDPRACS